LKLLSGERSQLLEALHLYANRVKDDFEARTGQILDSISGSESIPQGHNFSKVVNSIIWVRQLSGKLKRLFNISSGLFEDLKAFADLSENIQSICKNMQEYETEQFDIWRLEISGLLSKEDNSLALQLSGKLMEFDLKDGLLTINYSERLVLLLREVRQLAELGFRKSIPSKIIETVELGKRFYREALTLKQIAHFYNNMSSQIIPSQKPMILEQAMRFEEVVLNYEKNPKKTSNQANLHSISWDNVSDLEKYISRVQEASNDLISENRKLRKVHINISEILNDLFEVDLLKNREQWKERLEQAKRLREITILSLEAN
jgi:dynein heavy chain 2